MAAVFSNISAQTPSPAPASPPRAEVSRERKEEAYSKLMEGQRYLWQSNPGRSKNLLSIASNGRLAKTAFQRAVELDPTLAEGYTALAELALSTPPNDVDEAINLSSHATKIEPDNFGSHRILARLYTFKSRFNSVGADKAMVAKAITEWTEVTRLDPRNAEAWAFLSEFYFLEGKSDDQIAALKKWIASSVPLDNQFYRRTMGGRGDLSPENASIKLGMALVAAGKAAEAVAVMSEVVADNPDNADAIDILQEALESAGPTASGSAINSLAAAAYANPGNVTLVNLLSQIHTKAGRLDDAIKALRDASERAVATDKSAAAALDVSLGDLFASNDRLSEAIAAYEKALDVRGIKEGQAVADSDREFVVQVFDKMIKTYKNANRVTDVKAVIERARKLLGKNDLFADRQIIALYRETGKRQEAVAAVRAIRARFPNDYGLLRLEASILTEAGMVDQGVALIKTLINTKPITGAGGIGGGDLPAPSAPVLYDDFTNYLFISHLYNEANRGIDAKAAANQAYEVAGSEERKQLAKLTFATTQQMAGDFAGAETTLRNILKQTPGNPIALNNLGYFLLERNDRVNEALGLIQQALRIDPTNPSYLDSLGWANFMLGNFEEAERNLRTAARIDSGSGTIHEHLGDVYSKQGKIEQAKTAWHRALTLATNSADISRLRIKLQQ
jgi:tetratricopeptide (TPR) repeat protein